MIVDRAWIARNIGVDPATVSIPKSAFTTRAAAAPGATLDDIQRDIIDFDSEGPEGSAFLAFTKATGLSRFVDPPWPKGLAPTPAARAPAGGAKPLPQADVLIVTWTVDEGHALHHRRQESHRLQVRVAPVAGHQQTFSRERDSAERRALEADYRRGAAQAGSDHRHRRHRQGLRGRRRSRQPGRTLRLNELAEEGAVRQRPLR
jgi:hypothetical protein